MRTILATLLLVILSSEASAWNGLGHKVVADIAWQQLNEGQHAEIVRTLRRHPRFDPDFVRDIPEADQDRWIFQHAATWPDQIRGNHEYDMPTWHYVNIPLFIGDERQVDFNRSTRPEGVSAQWNVLQAVEHCREILNSDEPPQKKALAYCWLFHLVGDLHQPLHAVALVGDRFPEGDRGGNSIPVVRGRNLHALWDGLLGRRDRPNDVKRAVAELQERREWWDVDTTIDVPAWVDESYELCKSNVYSPEILTAIQHPGELAPITLPEEYLKSAGETARQRVVAAGLRLASLLNALSPVKPISIEDLEKLPIGIEVAHDPESVPATQTEPNGVLSKYTWRYKTTVSATDGDVRVVEFGAFYRNGDKWVPGPTFTGKPYAAKEFSEWYACPDALLKKGQSYSDPNNWNTGQALRAGTMRWYFVGLDSKGQRVKGEAAINLEADVK